jgi:hypothetical protein
MSNLSALRNARQSGNDLRSAMHQSQPNNTGKPKTALPAINQSPSKLMEAAFKAAGGTKYIPAAMKKLILREKADVKHGRTEGLSKTEVGAIKKVLYGGAMEKGTKLKVISAAIQGTQRLKAEHEISHVAPLINIKHGAEAAKSILKSITSAPKVEPPKVQSSNRMSIGQLRAQLGIQQTPLAPSAPAPSHMGTPAVHSGPTVNLINPIPITATPPTPTGSPITPIYGGHALAGHSPIGHASPPASQTDHQAVAPADKTVTPGPTDEQSAAIPADDSAAPKDVTLPDTSHLNDPFGGE